MALIESVFVRDYPEEYLAGEYLRLAGRIMAQVRDDPPNLVRRSRVLGDEKTELAAAAACLLRLASHQPDEGSALLRLFANSAKPSNDADRLAIRQLYAFLSQDTDTRLQSLNNWGVALSDLAKTKEGAEADRLFGEAAEKFAAALKIKPDYHEALLNWGNALSDQTETKEGAEADRLFGEAAEKYAAALEIKPDCHEALYNWGVTLSAQATTKEGTEADRLFGEAADKFAAALKIKPDKYTALNNWGATLATQAKAKKGQEAERLLREAVQKYVAALGIKPDMPEAVSNWGLALLLQAKNKEGQETGRRLLREAREKLLEAERIRPGSGAENLACVEALDGNVSEAVRWLAVCNSSGTRLTRKRIEADVDFDGIRRQPEFVRFVESLPDE